MEKCLFLNNFLAISELDISNLSDSDILLFEKMNTVFFLGQLVGLPTLQSILTKFDLSNKLQVNSTKLYKKLTIDKIRLIFEHVFESQVVDLLQNMALKDSSIWSKKE